jgi:hypothetical protein
MDLNSNQNMEQKSPLDEFKEFLAELWEMLKQDFHNSINFISSNKSFFTTAALLAILLQVSNISNLGKSFEKYCGERGMSGGGGNKPDTFTFQDMQAAKLQERADQKAEDKKAKKEARIQKKINAQVGTLEGTQKTSAINEIIKKAKAKEDASALKTGKTESISQYKTNKAAMREQDKLMKANKERISFFEGIKKKFHSTLSPGALGGPLFGRLDLIFDSVKDVFYIVAVILTIAGVISLPVLVFLIITYYVFKSMISKFIIL